MAFAVAVIDLRAVEIEHFRASGEFDDLLLGLLAHGDTIPGYLEEIAQRVKQFTGTSRLDAIEKLVAVLAIGDTRATGVMEKDFQMWMEEVKDRQIVKDIIEIAGKDRLQQERLEGEAEGMKRAYAGLVFEVAADKGLSSDEGLIDFLVENGDDATLKAMARSAADMDDLGEFLARFDFVLPQRRM